ncbi:PREDICTED: histidine-containing phosphotransfer protein 1-like [Lupinus angustifolius]|nr:PREDICTED: histidine-containing phosphotransfer protein 1-like [Lupinus angustifolius]XP_019448061.1 PREDICTED: histidine-containing phosphotransfer protein 1-like [Lupinus angustifolius]XP_019448062.1 PREDICTED: histidine-containing phosphotransfer protein 1-like [Lupinus angustifolius]
MTLSILKGLLQDYLRSLFNEGIVNDQFNEILSLENTRGLDYVVTLINTYIADVEMILSDISRHIENSKVDFSHMASLAHAIEDKSASIGAEHMKLACSDLIKACDEKHKRKLIRSLPWTKSEFTQTKNKLMDFVRMEMRIIRFQSSQP